MKKFYVIAFAFAIVGCLFLSSCGHNVGLVGVGTGFRLGNGEYGFSYGDGLFGTFVTKEGAYFKAEIDNTTGVSFDPTTNSYKGIKSVEYSLPPQINGYAVEFARENPDVAKEYYKSLSKYYEQKYGEKKVAVPAISDAKSTEASKSIADVIKVAIEKAKALVGSIKDEKNVFECSGDCEYTDLGGNKSIEYQLSIAMKLLTYDGYQNKMATTGEYFTTTIEHFITKNVEYQARGNTETPLRFKAVVVKDKVITSLSYAFEDGGKDIVIDCPSCILLAD